SWRPRRGFSPRRGPSSWRGRAALPRRCSRWRRSRPRPDRPPAPRPRRSGRRPLGGAAPMRADAVQCRRDRWRRHGNVGIEKTWFADAARAIAPSMGTVEPGIDLPLGLVPRHAVTLLQTAGEFRALALDHVHVVVGELAPFLLNLALELFPVAFDAVPIHRLLPWEF